MLDLTVVIVNYRCWDTLSICLESLKNQSVKIKKVIVVDNFSNDNKIDGFIDKFYWVDFIQEQVNGGFSHGNNIGAKLAKTKWILFLNPDTEIPKNCFETLIKFCDNNSDFRLITIKQINKKGELTYPFGVFPNTLNVVPLFRSIERLFNRSKSKKIICKNDISFPNWISGSFILIRKEDFSKIGGWDESFWMYFEDVDLCKRADENLMKRVILNTWSCIHNHGGASRKNNEIKIKTKSEVIISSHKYVNKHFSGLNKLVAQILIIIQSTIELVILSFFSKVKRGVFLNLISYWIRIITIK